MKTNKHLNWLLSILAFVALLFIPGRLTAAINKSQSINQITKNTPLILQHASASTIANLDHGSHVSHASHASHFSHYSSM
jgi:spore coat protein U-like protein